ncbi:hypothetical protein HAX54_024077 [Datura stramonium]|uniref:Uncharacterized protein n=1 Tax=Datura stramonium TaxID=4076 RepID=A0ABS8UZJ9_DATST|nr:hypothetical protein [Datura stramonium]
MCLTDGREVTKGTIGVLGRGSDWGFGLRVWLSAPCGEGGLDAGSGGGGSQFIQKVSRLVGFSIAVRNLIIDTPSDAVILSTIYVPEFQVVGLLVDEHIDDDQRIQFHVNIIIILAYIPVDPKVCC